MNTHSSAKCTRLGCLPARTYALMSSSRWCVIATTFTGTQSPYRQASASTRRRHDGRLFDLGSGSGARARARTRCMGIMGMGMGMSSSGSGAHAHSLDSHIHIQAHGAVRVLTVLALLQTSFWLERCPLGRTAPGRAARCSSPAPGLFVPEDGVHTPCTLCHAPGAYGCNPIMLSADCAYARRARAGRFGSLT